MGGAINYVGFRLVIRPLNVMPAEGNLAQAKRETEEKIAAQREDKLYCVIDLSGGPNAKRYPVTYLNSAPKTGWSDEYKTTKLVLRKIKPGSFLWQDSSADRTCS